MHHQFYSPQQRKGGGHVTPALERRHDWQARRGARRCPLNVWAPNRQVCTLNKRPSIWLSGNDFYSNGKMTPSNQQKGGRSQWHRCSRRHRKYVVTFSWRCETSCDWKNMFPSLASFNRLMPFEDSRLLIEHEHFFSCYVGSMIFVWNNHVTSFCSLESGYCRKEGHREPVLVTEDTPQGVCVLILVTEIICVDFHVIKDVAFNAMMDYVCASSLHREEGHGGTLRRPAQVSRFFQWLISTRNLSIYFRQIAFQTGVRLCKSASANPKRQRDWGKKSIWLLRRYIHRRMRKKPYESSNVWVVETRRRNLVFFWKSMNTY